VSKRVVFKRRELGPLIWWSVWLGITSIGALIAITEFGAPWWLAAALALYPAIKTVTSWRAWWQALDADPEARQ